MVDSQDKVGSDSNKAVAPVEKASKKTRRPKKKAEKKLSPGRRQFLEFKAAYPDALLLIRMGDFYECFDDDAHVLSRVLGIALTARESGGGAKAPLAGIPHHALENHLGTLIAAGLKIAIAEQTSDPAKSRGLVERKVVRVVTPGTVIEPELLDRTTNNYLAAAVCEGDTVGLSYVDISTSEFVTSEINFSEFHDELARLAPAELLVDTSAAKLLDERSGTNVVTRPLDETRLDSDLARARLLDHFKSKSLEAYGCEGLPMAITAASAVLEFVAENQFGAIPQLTSLRTESSSSFMKLDQKAIKDLELFSSSHSGSTGPTLYSTLNRTKTAMGARALRSWLTRPLMNVTHIRSRQLAVEAFSNDAGMRSHVQDLLSQISDLERLTNRVRTSTANPRDLASLRNGLQTIPALLEQLPESVRPNGALVDKLHACVETVELLQSAIADEPSINVGEGGAIREGFSPELDEVRSLSGDARTSIALLESGYKESTGIKSLKIGYNRVFGYYLEVSKSNVDLVPETFERRQTLVNGERFVTPELKELESKILTARDRISEIERDLFRRVCTEVSVHSERIMETATALGIIDCVASIGQTASENGWIKPNIDESGDVAIRGGRHPVVEASLGPGRFIPNDLDLSADTKQVMIITGPNMSGKSTYIRQAAVLVLMAQIGSFVPADTARIGIVDRIFTRAGLSDDITGGQSTFMVEMVETASILNQATSRSLAVLDEIGRGTSTYDGLAIARSVAEHIHNSPRLGCKTLFATHYHEMTELGETLARAHNLRVAVAEDDGDVVFLHQIVEGGADKSYGVHVARLAGMPGDVVNRAWELLDQLENMPGRKSDEYQLPMSFGEVPTQNNEALEALRSLDLSNMTPIEALNALFELQAKALDE